MSDQVSKEAKENNLTLGFIRKEAETEGGKNNGRKEESEGWQFYRVRWKVGEMICAVRNRRDREGGGDDILTVTDKI